MSTNDTIIGMIERGSFHFPIEFDMFNNHQYIPDATFDTGCSHSLISVKSLNIGNKSISDLKKEALYDIDVKLGLGKGIESKDINTEHLKKILYTKIFSDNNQIFLLAKKNTPLADNELDITMAELKEQLELLNE